LGLDINDLDVGILLEGTVVTATPNVFSETYAGGNFTFYGSGFTYDANFIPTGGIVTGFHQTFGALTIYDVSGMSIPVANWEGWALTDNTAAAVETVLFGDDTFIGSDAADTAAAFSGSDSLSGGAGDDVLDGGPGFIGGPDAGNNTISGGAGDDTLGASSGTNYLRGDDGDDYVQGGSGFDDINGNKGEDSIDGGSGGADWLVGGQGGDLIVSHHSDDILYGNLGNDSLSGGDGNEILRGGKDDDLILAGDGNDWISGDRGADTETGGAGADTFHSSSGAGLDRVLDFHASEGDRVMLDPGTHYTVAQVGADTVIDMGNGDEMVLVGVQLNTLPGGWIFGA
jgi:Ca2+-binding RTX toxin-like protein